MSACLGGWAWQLSTNEWTTKDQNVGADILKHLASRWTTQHLDVEAVIVLVHNFSTLPITASAEDKAFRVAVAWKTNSANVANTDNTLCHDNVCFCTPITDMNCIQIFHHDPSFLCG